MTNIKLTRHELLKHLEEQLYFLDSAISNYSHHSTIKKFDNKVIGRPLQIEINSEVEAKRISLIVRILVHDTTRSISLLQQLTLKDCMRFLDTVAPHDGRLHSMTNMHGVRGSNSGQYLGLIAKINTGNSLIATPLFSQHLKECYDGYKKLDFDTWWNKVIVDISGNKFTRKDLVLNVANKDGGAHIDSELLQDFELVKKTNLSLNIQGTETEFERNIIYASLTQIGWELLNSM